MEATWPLREKGAKGILILAPVVLRKETKPDNQERETEGRLCVSGRLTCLT
jgi:hypothetical protein